MPNGVTRMARNQIIGPVALPTLSFMMPSVTNANKKDKSEIPMVKTAMK
jgi:hypothetical protein